MVYVCVYSVCMCGIYNVFVGILCVWYVCGVCDVCVYVCGMYVCSVCICMVFVCA